MKQMIWEAILDEYKRIQNINTCVLGGREHKRAALKKFNLQLTQMRATGTLSDAEYKEVLAGMEAIDRFEMSSLVAQLNDAYAACLK